MLFKNNGGVSCIFATNPAIDIFPINILLPLLPDSYYLVAEYASFEGFFKMLIIRGKALYGLRENRGRWVI